MERSVDLQKQIVMQEFARAQVLAEELMKTLATHHAPAGTSVMALLMLAATTATEVNMPRTMLYDLIDMVSEQVEEMKNGSLL